MFERKVYHVLRRDDATWEVMKEGFTRPHIVRVTKTEAILIAKRLAKLAPNARVIVHSPDNHIEREFSYTASLV
jgi:hypothetical protein